MTTIETRPLSRSPRTPGGCAIVAVTNEPSKEVVILPTIRTSDGGVDRKQPLPTSLQSDFLPQELVMALTKPPVPGEKLGPPSRYRNLNTTAGASKKIPANLWNFPHRRDKFKHLTENTPCLCGAGQDISFLYDVPKKPEDKGKVEAQDPSSMRLLEDYDSEDGQPREMKLPDTLIPEEYHIVKNKGVMGLEYYEDNFATQPEDHEQHLVLFPSMNPNSRYEVRQLHNMMNEMLEKIGADEEDIAKKGPTQMHNLLELIKREQDIYNIVFHELIRQVSVECVDRGELLSTLRGRYSGLLNKVPKQIKGLHEEVLAQRALDRRLTEELMRFKSTISILTSELSDVKEHDMEVSRQANEAQDDLKTALSDSHKNAGLLQEYHELYELQRKRLEKQVSVLAEEREIWSTAAYSLALKVMEEHSLNTAKRLHVCEKAWCKLATHFTILLSDQDTDILTRLQGFADKWRDMVEDFNLKLKQREAENIDNLQKIRARIKHWIKDFQRNLMNKNGHFIKTPDQPKMQSLYDDIKSWEQVSHDIVMLAQEGEKFGGDVVLTGQEALYQIRQQMDGWTDCALRLFARHPGEGGSQHHEHGQMLKLNQVIDGLLKQYSVRLTGENGVATGMIHFSNGLEAWDSKLNAMLHGQNPMPDQEWLRLFQMMDEWIDDVDQTLKWVGVTQNESDRLEAKLHENIDFNMVLQVAHKWLTSSTNSIDSEDANLVEQVTRLHTEMVQWMVQVLLHLAPDRADHTREAREALVLGSATVPQLEAAARHLFMRLSHFTEYVVQCCSGIVSEDMERKKERMEEDAEKEHEDLKRFKRESEDWAVTAKRLVSELTGQPYIDSPSASTTDIGLSQEASKVTTDDKELPKDDSSGETLVSEDSTATTDSKSPSTEEESKPTEDETAEVQQEETPTAEENGDLTSETPVAEDAPTEGSPVPAAEAPGTPEQSPATPQPESESPPPDIPEPGDQLETIGEDANTHVMNLVEEAGPEVWQAQQEKIAELSKDRPETPNTQRSYEALAAVSTLQTQLMATEERAQGAEERCTEAELNLRLAEEKIRHMQRRLAEMTGEEEEEEEEETESPSKSDVTQLQVTVTDSAVSTAAKDVSQKSLLSPRGSVTLSEKGSKEKKGPSRTSSRSSSKASKKK